jgi:hypothetical protein
LNSSMAGTEIVVEDILHGSILICIEIRGRMYLVRFHPLELACPCHMWVNTLLVCLMLGAQIHEISLLLHGKIKLRTVMHVTGFQKAFP